MPAEFNDKIRLRNYLVGVFPYLETASAVKKAIRKNQIVMNDSIGATGDWVTAGSEIIFEWEYKIEDREEANLQIQYEDDDLIVIAKPPGLASSGNRRSLQSDLHSHVLEEKEGNLPFPYLVHRLDKATEGLIIAAKTISSRRILAKLLEQHKIIKEYVLIVQGHLSKSIGTIEIVVDGKVEKTEILKANLLDTKDAATRVHVRLHTGKTHQIRRHFAHIGHPIVGDQLYNKEGLSFGSGLLLCANYLEFCHPIHQEIIKVDYSIPIKISKYRVLG